MSLVRVLKAQHRSCKRDIHTFLKWMMSDTEKFEVLIMY